MTTESDIPLSLDKIDVMVKVEEIQKIALSFAEATEEPHFEKTSFRIRKKIFCTLDSTKKTLVVKLSEENQAMYSSHDNSIIYPVNGSWGRQGWTTVELGSIKPDLLKAIVTSAYCQVAPKKLSQPYLQQGFE